MGLLEEKEAVDEALIVLDVFLAGYHMMPDDDLARAIPDDDLLTWGQLRTIRHALALSKGSEG